MLLVQVLNYSLSQGVPLQNRGEAHITVSPILGDTLVSQAMHSGMSMGRHPFISALRMPCHVQLLTRSGMRLVNGVLQGDDVSNYAIVQVITPPEFANMQPFVSQDELNDLANKTIQASPRSLAGSSLIPLSMLHTLASGIHW